MDHKRDYRSCTPRRSTDRRAFHPLKQVPLLPKLVGRYGRSKGESDALDTSFSWRSALRAFPVKGASVFWQWGRLEVGCRMGFAGTFDGVGLTGVLAGVHDILWEVSVPSSIDVGTGKVRDSRTGGCNCIW